MSVKVVKIGELLDKSFFIPSYQRGYRWTKKEVVELLDDVYEFDTKGGTLEYCIQPLIVKEKGERWEVVDGQQRLTTIFILLKTATQLSVKPFILSFDTRKNSEEFLTVLKEDGEIDDSNIDYFHITSTRKVINEWTRELAAKEKTSSNVVLWDIVSKFLKSVVFIWYEISEEVQPIEMFEKVNLGKIPLTNAELIKALLLSKDNLGIDSGAIQKEISISWDKIEQRLQDDNFWSYFNNEINADENETGTRIDVLFDILSLQPKYLDKNLQSDSRRSYLTFSKKMNDIPSKKEYIISFWNDIEKLYGDLCYWYDDVDNYHLIGFVIDRGEDMRRLLLELSGKKKSDVSKILFKKIKTHKSFCSERDKLANLTYDEKEKVRYMLLLFNIATLYCKSAKETRFPFKLYKKGKWDIDHIHASADGTQEEDDSLGNLTLLSSDLNRGCKDSPFDKKRNVIINQYGKDGRFLPLCTRNIFLKAYTKDITKSQMDKWTDIDKSDYIESFADMINQFVEKGGE